MAEIESKALRRLHLIQQRLLDSTPELRDLKKFKGRTLDVSKDSRPNTSTSIKKKREYVKDAGPREQELLSKEQELRSLIEIESEKVKQMERDMIAREERYIRREKEYRKTLSEYESELRARGNYSSQPLDEQIERNYNKVGRLYGQIEDNIGNIQRKTTQILTEQERDIKRQFETRMKEINRELDDEKKRKTMGVDNYAEKAEQLARELELMKASMDLIENKNEILKRENGLLKQKFRTQEAERNLLVRQIVDYKRENAQIAAEIAMHKEILNTARLTPSMSKADSEFDRASKMSDYNFRQENSTDSQKISRYEKIISRLNRQIEVVRKGLKKVRNDYATEIQCKTEIEQILRECVEEVKSEIQTTRRNQKDSVSLTIQEREKIMEKMLSQERVLSLLYDKTFPSNPIAIDIDQD
jgi:hypothetical protein